MNRRPPHGRSQKAQARRIWRKPGAQARPGGERRTLPSRLPYSCHAGRDRKRRETKKLAVRIQKASFEEEKTLEGFDFAFNPKIKRGAVTDLAACLFIEKKEHVLIYGPAGVGKTHLAQALGHEGGRRGYGVLFVKAVKMLRHLFASIGPISRGKGRSGSTLTPIC